MPHFVHHFHVEDLSFVLYVANFFFISFTGTNGFSHGFVVSLIVSYHISVTIYLSSISSFVIIFIRAMGFSCGCLVSFHQSILNVGHVFNFNYICFCYIYFSFLIRILVMIHNPWHHMYKNWAMQDKQLQTYAIVWLLNRPYGNEGILRGQRNPSKC